MALFPAYASGSENKTTNEAVSKTQDETWLENSSFKIDVTGFQPTTSDSLENIGAESNVHLINSSENDSNESDVSKQPKRKKKRKKKSKHHQNKVVESETKQGGNDFKIDKTQNREFLTVQTIARPSAPKYRISFRMYRPLKTSKRKLKRYFHFIVKNENTEKETKLTKQDLTKDLSVERNEDFTGFKQEADMSQTTAFYNRSLAENPRDVELWLKYVRYQDAVFQFEKVYRKGSMAKGLRVTADRKLAILDKALSHNPDCELLMRERLNITANAYPADELQIHLKKLVEKEPGNIIWWQGYIEASQCSMSHCNIPAVLKLYAKCLSTLHQLRRNSVLEKSHLEENILRMLYQCGLFLKQSGLFEQLWTLLRLYLELNLSPTDKNKFNIVSGFEEKQLVELEEVVLQSQLPIHELWLRVERLREACHWLPFIGDHCEDPQVCL